MEELNLDFLKSRYTGKLNRVPYFREDRKQRDCRRYLEFLDVNNHVVWVRKESKKKYDLDYMKYIYYLCDYPPYSKVRHTRIYTIWNGIMNRCNQKNNKKYMYYGGRGIKVCERWRHFSMFYDDNIKEYKDNLTIERIDVNGNYEPKNCRWATLQEQAYNKRSNMRIAINGVEKNVTEWAEIYNIKRNTITTRILKYGWDKIDAVTTPKLTQQPFPKRVKLF